MCFLTIEFVDCLPSPRPCTYTFAIKGKSSAVVIWLAYVRQQIVLFCQPVNFFSGQTMFLKE